MFLSGCCALTALSLGCSDEGRTAPASADAAEVLRAAAERTLALDSFSIVVEVVADRVSGEYTASYQRPDRTRIVEGDRSITIALGRQTYSSMPDDPEAFTLTTAGDSAPLSTQAVLDPLVAMRDATDVTRQRRYLIVLPDDEGSMEVGIEGDHVTYIRTEWQAEGREFATVQRLSRFDAVPAIERPPADQVTEVLDFRHCPPPRTPPELRLCTPSSGSTSG